MNFIQKNPITLLLILTYIFLSSCNALKYRKSDPDVPVNADERVRKNVEEGRGIKLYKSGQGSSGGVASFATANSMWQATLTKLDFMVLSSVDYNGGIIITDWYSEINKPNESIKITVRFLSDEIRADGLNISIHQKKCEKTNINNCVIKKITPQYADEIKLSILKKAALIEKNKTAKYRKEYLKNRVKTK
jgi:hypothetical protein